MVNILNRLRVLHLSVNIPGPLASSRLAAVGAAVTKVESLAGDQVKRTYKSWYDSMHEKQRILTLDLKDSSQYDKFLAELEPCQLYITSLRPLAQQNLRTDPTTLQSIFPKLNVITIQGYPKPYENKPAHDLTIQAEAGLLHPPRLPEVLLADFAVAERVFAMSLLCFIHSMEHPQERGLVHSISFEEVVQDFCFAHKIGATKAGGPLGGGHPGYGVYEAHDGWISVAALEPHFMRKLLQELQLEKPDRDAFARVFRTRSCNEWTSFAEKHDVPITSVKDA